ncbi:MAG: hypothetical protein K8L91_07310 [Anaerolineae bacterium]|nr:hypothetical protein [Anaerolineae bacterium]
MTESMVHDVFGITAKVIPCPVSGAPLVVPQSEKGNRSKPELAGMTDRHVIELASAFNNNGAKEHLA